MPTRLLDIILFTVEALLSQRTRASKVGMVVMG